MLVKLLYKMKDVMDKPHEYTYTYRWQMPTHTYTHSYNTVRLSERRPARAGVGERSSHALLQEL
jgi:hypothetical protein